jgi:tripartite-type tricarboxylate transporter receptor subunit TctC
MTLTISSSPRRRWLRTAALTGALALLGASALAQAWPNRPIRMVVGFAPGGGTDVMARALAQALTESLGQPVIVDNKPGASGNIGAGEVVRAAPDGYTILLAPTSFQTVNPSLFKAPFDPAKDLTPLVAVGRSPMYIVARPTLEAKDAKELVALAKKQPGKFSYASSGSGTPPHLAGELFKQQTGITAVHVPYRGSGPALQDVMASQADYVFDPGIAFPHIRAGKVKLLAVTSAKRSTFFPDAPTLAEQGIQGADLDIWWGVWVPNNTPAEVKTRLDRDIAKALAQGSVKDRYNLLGLEPAYLEPAPFRTLLADETKLLTKLINERGIKAE